MPSDKPQNMYAVYGQQPLSNNQSQYPPPPQNNQFYDINDNERPPDLPFNGHAQPSMKHMSNKFRQSLVDLSIIYLFIYLFCFWL